MNVKFIAPMSHVGRLSPEVESAERAVTNC